MHARKNPLQVLQNMTRKGLSDAGKTTNSLLIGNIYQPKSEKTNSSNDGPLFKKIVAIDLSKGNFTDLNLSLPSSQPDTKDRSASREKRPTSKRGSFHLEKLQYLPNKNYYDLKSTVRDTSTSNVEPSPHDKKSKDGDINYIIKKKLQNAYDDFHEGDFNSALLSLIKAENIADKALQGQEELKFDTLFFLFYNMISVKYKYYFIE